MVPKGHQRYAIGMSFGYRDILQNLEKIERGVHAYLRHHQTLNTESNLDSDTPIPSPTLKQLLQFEAETNVHDSLPRLKGNSSALGLLWAKRQLHYATLMFTNVLDVPVLYSSAEEAAWASYYTVYIDYHGWAVKQLFTSSFGGSPPLEKFWLNLSPPTDAPKKRGKYNNKKDDYPPPARTLSDANSSSTTSERTDDDDDEDNEVLVALDNFRVELVEKWEDLLRMFNCGKEEKRKQKENLILSSESHFNLSQFHRDMVDSSLEEKMGAEISDLASDSSNVSSPVTGTTTTKKQAVIQKSKRDTEDFIRGISPIIADLGTMFDQLNMNDPSKV